MRRLSWSPCSTVVKEGVGTTTWTGSRQCLFAFMSDACINDTESCQTADALWSSELMCPSCLLAYYLRCCLHVTLWNAESLVHVKVLTRSPCDFLLSLCLLIHAVMIHTAALLQDWCVIHTPGPLGGPGVTCCLTSSSSGCFCVDKFSADY